MSKALSTSRPLPFYSFHFIASPSVAALTHRNPASAGISRDSYGIQDSDKRNALCKSFTIVLVTTADLRRHNILKQQNTWITHSTATFTIAPWFGLRRCNIGTTQSSLQNVTVHKVAHGMIQSYNSYFCDSRDNAVGPTSATRHEGQGRIHTNNWWLLLIH
jgi:hypothetical protein